MYVAFSQLLVEVFGVLATLNEALLSTESVGSFTDMTTPSASPAKAGCCDSCWMLGESVANLRWDFKMSLKQTIRRQKSELHIQCLVRICFFKKRYTVYKNHD